MSVNIKYRSIVLRAIEEKDLDFCRDMMNNADIEATTVGKRLPISELQQKNWFLENDNKDIRLLIENQNGLIGMIMMTDIDWINRSMELGIKLVNTQNRTTENTLDICSGVLQYAFDELNMHCLYANVIEQNLFSRKLLIRYGFHEDGILRERVFKRGQYLNLCTYSLLSHEYCEMNDKRTVIEKMIFRNSD